MLLPRIAPDTWNNGYSACAAATSATSFPPNGMGFGRLAVFLNNTVYQEVMKYFMANPKASSWGKMWIGGITNGTPSLLSEYWWMTNANSGGDRITRQNIAVGQNSPLGNPACLMVDIMNPNTWFSSACTATYFALCEFGMRSI